MQNNHCTIKGLLFDFDGLILETEGPIYRSWQELFAAHGGELPFSLWGTIIGTSEMSFDPWRMLEELAGGRIDRVTAGQKRRERELELVRLQPVMPGVVDYLQQGRQLGLKMAVVSSSSRAWVAGHLERLGIIQSFDCLITSDDVKQTKPDPELYITALRALRLKPEEAVAFEDSTNGVTAAKAAGIYVVAVPNDLTRQLPLDHADLRLDSLAELELPRLLERIRQSGA